MTEWLHTEGHGEDQGQQMSAHAVADELMMAWASQEGQGHGRAGGDRRSPSPVTARLMAARQEGQRQGGGGRAIEMGFAPNQEPQASKDAPSFSFPRAPAQLHTATLPGRAAPRQVEEPDQAPQAAQAFGSAIIAQLLPGYAPLPPPPPPPPLQANEMPYGPDDGEVFGPDHGLVRITTWKDNASPKIKVWSQTEPGACMNPGGFELPSTWEPPATGRTAAGAGAAQWPSVAVSIPLSSDLGGPAGGAGGAPLPAPIRRPGGQAEGGQGVLARPPGLHQGLRAEAEPFYPKPNPKPGPYPSPHEQPDRPAV